ncbi:MAG: hypothetical protein AAF846_21595 [Chloroflexota bacterium]
MTQPPDMSEMDEYYERTRRPLFNIPDNRAGRFGCGLIIFGWFIVLLLPFTMIWLAFGNSLTIPRNNVPESELHPRLQVQLVMEVNNRGLKFTSTSLNRSADTQLCIENNTNYLLWENDASASPATYCQCYERPDAESEWQFSQQIESSCNS